MRGVPTAEERAAYCFVRVGRLFAGGWRPRPSQETKETSRLPEIAVLVALADPVPDAEQGADPGAAPGIVMKVRES